MQSHIISKLRSSSQPPFANSYSNSGLQIMVRWKWFVIKQILAVHCLFANGRDKNGTLVYQLEFFTSGLHLNLSARRLHPGSVLSRLRRGLPALGLLQAPSSIRVSLGQLSFCLHHELPGLRLHLDPPPLRLHLLIDIFKKGWSRNLLFWKSIFVQTLPS